jgi:hypothetical protein
VSEKIERREVKEINDTNSYVKKYQFPRGIGLEDDRRAIGGYGPASCRGSWIVVFAAKRLA